MRNACGFVVVRSTWFLPEPFFVGVEEEVASVLPKDNVGAINYCFCGCRMVLKRTASFTSSGARFLRVLG